MFQQIPKGQDTLSLHLCAGRWIRDTQLLAASLTTVLTSNRAPGLPGRPGCRQAGGHKPKSPHTGVLKLMVAVVVVLVLVLFHDLYLHG